MRLHHLVLGSCIALAFAAAALAAPPAPAIAPPHDPNDYPNGYHVDEGWAKLPNGRKFGGISAVDMDRDGKSVWVFDRCQSADGGCATSNLPPVLEFGPDGSLLRSWGSSQFKYPHGIFVDAQDNIWTADGIAKDGAAGQVVRKWTRDGKLLMTLGSFGVTGSTPDLFNGVSDVLVAPNGDIFVADGHGTVAPDLPPDTITRIIKFSADGKFIKAWGSLGSGKSQFRNPHALAFDSKGRLLVADRVNGRIQVFDQDGKWLTEYRQFNHPSGLFMARGDVLYTSDYNSDGQKGIYIGSAATGKLKSFVPDPEAGEGVALGPDGVIYEATPNGITRFMPKVP